MSSRTQLLDLPAIDYIDIGRGVMRVGQPDWGWLETTLLHQDKLREHHSRERRDLGFLAVQCLLPLPTSEQEIKVKE